MVTFEEEFALHLDLATVVKKLETIKWQEGDESSMGFSNSVAIAPLNIANVFQSSLLACIDTFLEIYVVSLGSGLIKEEFQLVDMQQAMA